MRAQAGFDSFLERKAGPFQGPVPIGAPNGQQQIGAPAFGGPAPFGGQGGSKPFIAQGGAPFGGQGGIKPFVAPNTNSNSNAGAQSGQVNGQAPAPRQGLLGALFG